MTALRVDEAIRGSFAAGDVVEIVEPGGTVDGVTLVIPGAPRFAPGEKVLLFLDQREDGRWTSRNFALGKFTFTRVRVRRA